MCCPGGYVASLFVGKEYEDAVLQTARSTSLSAELPGDYREYLRLLPRCLRRMPQVLEPGGTHCLVNVANLGRKPYRSLSADVIGIFESLGLLLRGEVIWRKASAASGSCAWGSFRSPANPVLRDVTERIVIASKGRFDRAFSSAQRKAQELPFRPQPGQRRVRRSDSGRVGHSRRERPSCGSPGALSGRTTPETP